MLFTSNEVFINEQLFAQSVSRVSRSVTSKNQGLVKYAHACSHCWVEDDRISMKCHYYYYYYYYYYLLI